jgi:hypothetical protein
VLADLGKQEVATHDILLQAPQVTASQDVGRIGTLLISTLTREATPVSRELAEPERLTDSVRMVSFHTTRKETMKPVQQVLWKGD